MSRWKSGRRRRTQIDGQFAARTIKMLESPAYRTLSLSAHRVLARLEIELAHHGGMDNGRLPVTYDDFEGYGIDRHAIAPAIRELVTLGFVEITEPGRAGNAEWRTPNRFRLTYKPTKDLDPNNGWARFGTLQQAETAARSARAGSGNKAGSAAPKNETPVSSRATDSGGFPHRGLGRKSPTTSDGDIAPPLSTSRGGGAGEGIKTRVRIKIFNAG